MEHSPEPKKSFALIYISVAVLYAIMITVYSVVVHKATLDGARDPSVVDKDKATRNDAALMAMTEVTVLEDIDSDLMFLNDEDVASVFQAA